MLQYAFGSVHAARSRDRVLLRYRAQHHYPARTDTITCQGYDNNALIGDCGMRDRGTSAVQVYQCGGCGPPGKNGWYI
jgi:hypothetical protein